MFNYDKINKLEAAKEQQVTSLKNAAFKKVESQLGRSLTSEERAIAVEMFNAGKDCVNSTSHYDQQIARIPRCKH